MKRRQFLYRGAGTLALLAGGTALWWSRGSDPATAATGEFEIEKSEAEWREIGLGAQILRDLGISSIRLLASRRRHYVGLEGFGIAITATDIIDAS